MACYELQTFKSSLGARRHSLAYIRLLNSESRISNQVIAAKLRTVVPVP